MKTIDGTTLASMTINMLERTAMVLAEPAMEGEEQPPATRFAKIEYHGPSAGTLILAATDGFLSELAAGLLGVEAAEVDLARHGGDALKEVANIVGGSMILALSGDVCEYSLGLPELLKSEGALPAESPGSAAARAECTVIAEGGPLRVFWRDVRSAKAACWPASCPARPAAGSRWSGQRRIRSWHGT
jgi:CheY-specific phosphatase CheX